MKGDEAKGNQNPDAATVKRPASSPAAYEQVFDGRKLRVRGLWKRGGSFYGRFTATDHAGKKRDAFRALEGAASVPAAKAALQKLRDEAAKRSIPTDGRCPTFAEFGARYVKEVSSTKRPATERKERACIAWWTERVGSLPINRIHRTHVHSGIAALTQSGLAPRTANLYVICLRVVLKRAHEEGLIHEMPTAGLRPLKVSTTKRELIEAGDFDKILSAAPEATKNATEFCDYLRFLLFSGAREKEALRVAWSDVDFENEQVTVGSDGLAKNHEARRVDFNQDLAALLIEMKERRAPDSQWLFPSPKRGGKDIPGMSLRASLHLSCAAAGVKRIGFHDCRHRFISSCVMSGLDYMTIAQWVGHKDGGVLIGKVYGHLSGAHRKAMASRLRLSETAEENVIQLPANR